MQHYIFMTNHHNYACWMSLYSLHLATLETIQLDIENVLTEGGFSVNRTGKSFAGVPVDLALEQTINADAKSRLKGIMTFGDISKIRLKGIMTFGDISKIQLKGIMTFGDISKAANWWVVTALMKIKILNPVYR